MAHYESRFMANIRSKFWSLIIVGGGLVLLFVLVRYAIMSPDKAKGGFKTLAGLPGWSWPIIMGAVGAVVFWLGLKVRSDWPEVLGAGLIAGAVGAAELMIGWKTFSFGISFLPILIPIGVFVILILLGNMPSR